MDANPLSSLYEGDFTIKAGRDLALYGPGNLNVQGKIFGFSTTESTTFTNGSLVLKGGLGVAGSLRVNTDAHITGISNFNQTNINTNDGLLTVTGHRGVNVSVGSTSTLSSTGGNFSVSATTQKLLLSAGLASQDAVSISNSHIDGGVLVSSGTGGGKVSVVTGTGGTYVFSSSGSVSLVSGNSGSNFTVNSQSSGQNLVLGVTGTTDSKVVVESTGTATAIELNTKNTSGTLVLSNVRPGQGSINLLAASGGLISTSTGVVTVYSTQGTFLGSGVGVTVTAPNFTGTCGSTSLSSNTTLITTTAGTSGVRNVTNSSAQDLTLSVIGNTDSSVILYSEGTAQDAVRVETTVGGVFIDSTETINIQSKAITRISTLYPGSSTSIGTPGSTTTINGDLEVKGTRTTINTATVVTLDNIVLVNSAPVTSSDGGIGVKRWQSANNSSGGDVVSGTGVTGTVGSTGNTATSVNISSVTGSTDYTGAWIKLVSGTGAGQVRRIKSITSGIAQIYSNADPVTTPTTGLDFLTVPDATTTFSIHSCSYVFSVWDESQKQFAMTCSPLDPEAQVTPLHYMDLRVSDIIADNAQLTTINDVPSDFLLEVTLTDSTTPVVFPSFPTSGAFNVTIVPAVQGFKPVAMFTIGKVTGDGICHRTLSVPGTGGSHLGIQWTTGNVPQLYYSPAPGDSSSTLYKVKVSGM